MATFIVLGSFTDQGIRSVKESPKRAEGFKALAAKSGVKVKEIYWTLGHYDLVTVVEAADAATVTSVELAVASMGNIKTETLTAFSAEEFGKILSKMPS